MSSELDDLPVAGLEVDQILQLEGEAIVRAPQQRLTKAMKNFINDQIRLLFNHNNTRNASRNIQNYVDRITLPKYNQIKAAFITQFSLTFEKLINLNLVRFIAEHGPEVRFRKRGKKGLETYQLINLEDEQRAKDILEADTALALADKQSNEIASNLIKSVIKGKRDALILEFEELALSYDTIITKSSVSQNNYVRPSSYPDAAKIFPKLMLLFENLNKDKNKMEDNRCLRASLQTNIMIEFLAVSCSDADWTTPYYDRIKALKLCNHNYQDGDVGVGSVLRSSSENIPKSTRSGKRRLFTSPAVIASLSTNEDCDVLQKSMNNTFMRICEKGIYLSSIIDTRFKLREEQRIKKVSQLELEGKGNRRKASMSFTLADDILLEKLKNELNDQKVAMQLKLRDILRLESLKIDYHPKAHYIALVYDPLKTSTCSDLQDDYKGELIFSLFNSAYNLKTTLKTELQKRRRNKHDIIER